MGFEWDLVGYVYIYIHDRYPLGICAPVCEVENHCFESGNHGT